MKTTAYIQHKPVLVKHSAPSLALMNRKQPTFNMILVDSRWRRVYFTSSMTGFKHHIETKGGHIPVIISQIP